MASAAPLRAHPYRAEFARGGGNAPSLRRLDRTAAAATILLLGSYATLAAIVWATGLSVDWSGLGVLLGFAAAVLAVGLLMKTTAGLGRVADLTLIAATLVGATLSNILSLNAGLRLRFPLRDAELRAADAAIGFDAAQLVARFAEHPQLMQWLNVVYVNSNWIAGAVVLLAGLRRTQPARALVCYAGGLMIVTAMSTLLPAVGNIADADLSRLPGLPAGSGTYHLPVFHYYYDGAGAVLGTAHLSGVAVFPSFHTIMGLVIATSLQGTRFAPVGALAGVATIVSAVPIGGHYIVDILAAVAVWAATMKLGTSRPE